MTDTAPLLLSLADEDATAALGVALAGLLQAGDCVLLSGPVGAGKSSLARALIQARLARVEDVPSPSFTLVQVYEADGVELWHADLYRLTHPDEVWELGLDEAFARAITLVEWPDRLGRHQPATALSVQLDAAGDGRLATVRGGRPGLVAGLAEAMRVVGIARFLQAAGWADADRQHLAGDASDRRYFRLRQAGASAVLMDNPPGGADDPAAFVTMAWHLRGLGLSAPEVLAADTDTGFLLLEDLGDDLFARLLARDPSREAALYGPAVDALSQLQTAPLPPGLPDLTAEDWAEAASLAVTAYAKATRAEADPAPLTRAMGAALRAHADGPRVLILRDYHAENLLWLPERQGLARVGLLDFQLGQAGQPGYDLVSLLQDARRDVLPETEAAMIARFVAATGALDFPAHYAVLGAQRALRILGVFTRLCVTVGKPGYIRLIPRVWAQLQRNLAHPALAELRAVCDTCLPVPSAEVLQRIESLCPTSRSP